MRAVALVVIAAGRCFFLNFSLPLYNYLLYHDLI
ncbi:unnamed protein product [Haemonchus placei]|uniref:7TM_GPCR_Srx domain-containing protein n=1 Tax=Haemonchus placei TaxID=6290 RepID=A0A0N4WE73_HAEPC|nr:unnamed protein product [Haemonchus placei]